MIKMECIYVGRLDKEKGIPELIFCTKKLIKNKLNFHIHIYGKGEYTDNIIELAKLYPENITYHWRKNKKDIATQRKISDFFMMTSLFLETFGLTACESLLSWVPVIWNKKWWLLPFIHKDLDIQQTKWENEWEKLYNLLKHLITHNITKHQYLDFIWSVQDKYTKEVRLNNINTNISLSQNIIMISDFINYNGWGIETHIHDISDILKDSNYEVRIYGHNAPSWSYATLQKLIIMILSFFNIYDSIRILQIIKRGNIWLIRRHSISRVFGRLPLWFIWHNNQIITHHELWLFHPFPSKTIQEDQLPTARSLWAFIKAGQTNNIFKKIAIIGKYCMIRCIHKQLQKKIKTHIVPSEWMIPMVHRRHPHAHVICIPHFVSL